MILLHIIYKKKNVKKKNPNQIHLRTFGLTAELSLKKTAIFNQNFTRSNLSLNSPVLERIKTCFCFN